MKTETAAKIPYYGITKYNGTNYQKVKVTFDVPEGTDTAQLFLTARLKGEGAYVKLDDVRLWENLSRSPRLTDPGMEDYVVYEDFENVEQGFGPFVADGGPGSTWDHRVHLAEKQEGSGQYSDYVADGHYSLKINQEGVGSMVRTNANTVQLKPNTKYQLDLEYITGVDGRYEMYVVNGAGDKVLTYAFTDTGLEEGTHSLASRTISETFTTGDSDDYYIAIWNVNDDAKATPEAPEMGNWLERSYLSLDNFSIKEIKDVNKSTLGYVLQLAQVHVDNGDVDNLIPAAKEQFEKTMAEAQAIYDDPDSTQEQVDQAWKKLLLVIQAMDFIPGDKTELAELIVQAQNMDLNQYEDGAEKEAFETALQEAVELLADPNAMANDITAAYDKLEAAMQALIPLPEAGDKTELKKAIDIANGHDLSKYVDDANKTNFLTVLEQAEAVYADEAATQDEIDEAWRNLLDAMTALRLRADKENLNDWLEELKAIDLTQYTEESAAAVMAAIANAEALASQDLGTDQEPLIRMAIAQMQLAKENLVLKDNNPGDSNSSGKPADSSSGSDANAGSDPAKTGDSAPIAAISVMAVAAAGALWMLKKRKD